MDNDLLLWALGLVSLFFGIKWQSAFKENESLRQQLSTKKEQLYADFVNLFMSLLTAEQKPTDAEIVAKMQQYNEQMILTGSNDVLMAYGDLMQYFYHQNSDSTELFFVMGELLLAMRKDLGHSDGSNSLQWFDPMRPWLKDISTLLPKKIHKFRYSKNRLHNGRYQAQQK